MLTSKSSIVGFLIVLASGLCAHAAKTPRPREIRVQALPQPGWIVVDAALANRGAAQSGKLTASLHRAGDDAALKSGECSLADPLKAYVKLDAADLPPGEYDVRMRRIGNGGEASDLPPRRVSWPGRDPAFAHVRILNNLVWELASIGDQTVKNRESFKFQQPISRWILVRATLAQDAAPLTISLDRETSAILKAGLGAVSETMRFLPAGQHELILSTTGASRIENLSVRSIPELIYSEYQSEPTLPQFGPFAGEFLDRYVFPNVNTLIVSTKAAPMHPYLSQWKSRGGKWLVDFTLPELLPADQRPANVSTDTVDGCVAAITSTVGMRDPAFDGVIADEFGGSEPKCITYADAIRKIAQAPQFAGKQFYPYCNSLYDGPDGANLITAALETGSAVAWERYLKTTPTEALAHQLMYDKLVVGARQFRDADPRAVEHLVTCFGYLSAPDEFTWMHPQVDFPAYLDMQFQLAANHPAFWGTYGLMTYLGSYADEELVRFGAQLQRHYGLDGATARFEDRPYLSPHLVNGDFDDGTTGWVLHPANPKSMQTTTRKNLGWLEGRYPHGSVGDTALLMAADPARPNRIEQTIQKLQPGKLYCLRLFTADVQDLSIERMHAIELKIDGAEPVERGSFSCTTRSNYSHKDPPFDDDHPAWMNYHRRIFRATSSTATLTMTDWPGGKPPPNAQQQLLINWVSVTPYLER